MLFCLILSVCLSMVFSIPSQFYALEESPEVTKCMETHAQEVEKCTNDWVEGMANKTDINAVKETLQTNPNALPDSQKKVVCCGFYQ